MQREVSLNGRSATNCVGAAPRRQTTPGAHLLNRRPECADTILRVVNGSHAEAPSAQHLRSLRAQASRRRNRHLGSGTATRTLSDL